MVFSKKFSFFIISLVISATCLAEIVPYGLHHKVITNEQATKAAAAMTVGSMIFAQGSVVSASACLIAASSAFLVKGFRPNPFTSLLVEFAGMSGKILGGSLFTLVSSGSVLMKEYSRSRNHSKPKTVFVDKIQHDASQGQKPKTAAEGLLQYVCELDNEKK